MKTRLLSIALCTLLLMAAGCKDPGKQNEPESIIGTTAKPAWTAPADYDMTSSMTAVVKVDLSAVYTVEQLSAAGYKLTGEDLVAAFAGDECLGVATPKDGLFYLYICSPANGQEVTLKYYSSVLKNVLSAAPIAFTDGSHLGSIAEPYTPQFAPAK